MDRGWVGFGDEFVAEGDFFAEKVFGAERYDLVLVLFGVGLDGGGLSGLAGEFGVDVVGGFAE